MKTKLLPLIILAAACGKPRTVVGPQGPKGDPGSPGRAGTNGHSALVSVLNEAPTCTNGGAIILSGPDMDDDGVLDSSEVTTSTPVCNGVNGTSGNNGHNALVALIAEDAGGGASCLTGGITVLAGTDLNDDGALQITEAQQSKDVCNGQPGAQGNPGVNGTNAPTNLFAVVGFENPCGDAPGVYDEIFLRLGNGKLIASFSENANGKNTRFSELVPGSYVTTDGDNCRFIINSNLQIVNESHRY